MRSEIESGPEYASLLLHLERSEEIIAESGAMVSMDTSLKVETGVRGGLLSGLKRSFLGGESLFLNRFYCEDDPASIRLAPGSDGDIVPYEMQAGRDLFVQAGSFLASGVDVQLDTQWDGFRGFLTEGFFLLRATGEGPLFLSSYGAIREIDVDHEYVVDNGFVVAFEEGLEYELERLPGLKTFFFGEGLVCRFRGRGKLYTQTRKPRALASFLHRFRPVKSKSNNDS